MTHRLWGPLFWIHYSVASRVPTVLFSYRPPGWLEIRRPIPSLPPSLLKERCYQPKRPRRPQLVHVYQNWVPEKKRPLRKLDKAQASLGQFCHRNKERFISHAQAKGKLNHSSASSAGSRPHSLPAGRLLIPHITPLLSCQCLCFSDIQFIYLLNSVYFHLRLRKSSPNRLSEENGAGVLP